MTGARAVRLASSGWVLAALVAPLAVLGATCAAGRSPVPALARSWTVLLWMALLAAALVARGATSLKDGRPVAGLAALAAALLVAQGWASAAFTLDVTLDAGEGEESPPATAAFAGRAASIPRVRALALPEREDGSALLSTPGREVPVRVGQEVEPRPGLTVRIEDVFTAPVFVIRHAGGTEETVGPVKLRPGRREYFQTRSLPHRFYVTVPASRPGEPAAGLQVRVQRGKLGIAEQELQAGQPLQFEGLRLVWTNAARWAPIRVRYTPRPWLAAGAGAVAVGAIAAALRGRRRA